MAVAGLSKTLLQTGGYGYDAFNTLFRKLASLEYRASVLVPYFQLSSMQG